MLALILSVLTLGWALWLTYMIRYPVRWAQKIDAFHFRLARYGLSLEWMKRAEKGLVLKALVGGTVVVMLACLAQTLLHPGALVAFISMYHAER